MEMSKQKMRYVKLFLMTISVILAIVIFPFILTFRTVQCFIDCVDGSFRFYKDVVNSIDKEEE